MPKDATLKNLSPKAEVKNKKGGARVKIQCLHAEKAI